MFNWQAFGLDFYRYKTFQMNEIKCFKKSSKCKVSIQLSFSEMLQLLITMQNIVAQVQGARQARTH